jgi:hypothetical protein
MGRATIRSIHGSRSSPISGSICMNALKVVTPNTTLLAVVAANR